MIKSSWFNAIDCFPKDDRHTMMAQFPNNLFLFTHNYNSIIQCLEWWPWIINRLSYSISKKKHKTITAFIWFSPSNETTHTMLIPPFFFEYYLQESMPFGIPWASDTRIMYEFNSIQCNPLHFFVFFVSFCFGVNAVLKY